MEQQQPFPEPPAPARRRESTVKEDNQLASIFAIKNGRGSASPQKKQPALLFDKGKTPSLFSNPDLLPLFKNSNANGEQGKQHERSDQAHNSKDNQNDLISLSPAKESNKQFPSIYPSIENFAANLGASRRDSTANADSNQDENDIQLGGISDLPLEFFHDQNQLEEEEEADHTIGMSQMFGFVKEKVEQEERNKGNALKKRPDTLKPTSQFAPLSVVEEQEEEGEMTMDLTKPMNKPAEPTDEEVDMDITKPLSKIVIPANAEADMEFTTVLPRRKSVTAIDNAEEVDMEFTTVQPSQNVGEEEDMEFTTVQPPRITEEGDMEEDMDFTNVPSKKKSIVNAEVEDMDFTNVPSKRKSIVNAEEEDMDFTNVPSKRKSIVNEEEQDMEFTTVMPPTNAEDNEEEEEDMDFTTILPQTNDNANSDENHEEEDMDLTTIPRQSNGNNDDEEDMEFTTILPALTEEDNDQEMDMDFTTVPKLSNVPSDNVRASPMKQRKANSPDKVLSVSRADDAKVFDSEPQDKENVDIGVRQTLKPVSPQKRLRTPPSNKDASSQRTTSPNTPTRASRSQRSSLRTPPSKGSGKKLYTASESGRKRRRVSGTPPPETRSQPNLAPPMTPSKSKQLEGRIIEMSPKKQSRTPIKPLPPPREEPSSLLTMMEEAPRMAYTPLSKMRKESIGSNTRLSILPNSPARPDDTVLSRVSEGDENEEEDPKAYPNISLTEFLKMITIDFMDELFLNSTRNQRQHYQEMSLVQSTDADKDPMLVDYATAMAKIPTLELYNFSFQEMRKNIREARELYAQIDAETLEESPLLFREFIEAEPDLKSAMISQFKLIKNYARLQARGVWYDWRLQLTHGLKQALTKRKETVEHDKLIIQRKKEEPGVNDIHARIAAQHAQMKERLESLRQRTSDLEKYDRNEILEARRQLKAAKSKYEQAQIEEREANEKLKAVDEQVEATLLQREEIEDSIKKCEKIKRDNRRIEVGHIMELEAKFDSLQVCTGLQFNGIHDQVFVELEMLNSLLVRIDMSKRKITGINLKPNIQATVTIQFFADQMLKLINNKTKLSLQQQVFEALRLWNATDHVNNVLENLDLYHRVDVTRASSESLNVAVRLLNFEQGAKFKAKVELQLNSSVIESFPQFSPEMALRSCNTKVSYNTRTGPDLQSGDMNNKIADTLSDRGIAGLGDVFNEIVEC